MSIEVIGFKLQRLRRITYIFDPAADSMEEIHSTMEILVNDIMSCMK